MSGLVVIFRAHAADAGPEYLETALRLRDTALADFGCQEFLFLNGEGGEQVAISYWPDEASIARWKAHADHQDAQREGRARWYASYRVQVAKVKRDYGFTR
jgi:heme-degrading monooxygenase HmoA